MAIFHSKLLNYQRVYTIILIYYNGSYFLGVIPLYIYHYSREVAARSLQFSNLIVEVMMNQQIYRYPIFKQTGGQIVSMI
jgi:hypothetical protein